MCYCTPSIRTPFCRNCNGYMFRRIGELRAELESVKKERDELVAALKSVQHVVNKSTGIIGWHLNGDIATWDELLPEVDAVLAKVGADEAAIIALEMK